MGLVGRAWLESTSDQKFFIEIRTSESLQHYTTPCDGYELFGLYRSLSSLALPSFNLQCLGQCLLYHSIWSLRLLTMLISQLWGLFR